MRKTTLRRYYVPYLLPTKGTGFNIIGEVWKVNQTTFDKLDKLEGRQHAARIATAQWAYCRLNASRAILLFFLCGHHAANWNILLCHPQLTACHMLHCTRPNKRFPRLLQQETDSSFAYCCTGWRRRCCSRGRRRRGTGDETLGVRSSTRT